MIKSCVLTSAPPVPGLGLGLGLLVGLRGFVFRSPGPCLDTGFVSGLALPLAPACLGSVGFLAPCILRSVKNKHIYICTYVYQRCVHVSIHVCTLYMLIVSPLNMHEQSLQEMLRKTRQQQQHNRKAKQHKTTRPKIIFLSKLAASGGTQTHDHQLSKQCSYQLSY